MRLNAVLAFDESHDRRTAPRRELHLRLLGTFVADGALDCLLLRWRQDAVFAAASAAGARCQKRPSQVPHSEQSSCSRWCSSAQHLPRFGSTNGLPAPSVLFAGAELPRIVFFEGSRIKKVNRSSIYLWAESKKA